MTSIITNPNAMLALSTLRSINNQLGKTENQISSGLRIADASDNAAYWSIATTMRSDNKAKSAVADSIGLGKAVLDVTYSGMDAIREELTTIRNLVVTAAGLPAPATDPYSNWTDYQPDEIYAKSQLAKVDLEINQHWKMIDSIVESASFSGFNLLKNDKTEATLPGAATEFVAGYADGKVQTISISAQDTVMINYNRTVDNMYGQPGSENQGFLDGILWSANIIFPITYIDPFDGEVKKNQNIYMLRNSELRIAVSGLDRQDSYNALINQIEERLGAITKRYGRCWLYAKTPRYAGQFQ